MTTRTSISLAILCVITFGVLFRAYWLQENNAPLSGDELAYNTLAQRIYAGQGFTLETGEPTAWRTPGFPLLLGLIYQIMGDDPGQARRVLASLTIFTSLGAFWLCLLLTKDIPCAMLSGMSWEALLTTNRLSGLLIGESSAALAFVLGLVFAVLAIRRDSIMLICAAGLLLGFAALIRSYLFLAWLGPVIWLLLEKKNRFAIVIGLVVVAVIGGWMIRNMVSLGSFTLSTQGPQELWCGNNGWARGGWPGDWMRQDSEQRNYLRTKYPEFDRADEVAQSRIFAREAIYLFVHHPAHILWLAPRKIAIYFCHLSFWGKDWVYLGLLPFSLIGAVCMWRSHSLRRTLWLIGAPIIGVMIVCLLTFGDPRFRHPVDPLIMILSSIGIVFLIRRSISIYKDTRSFCKKV